MAARVGEETLVALGDCQPGYSPGPVDELGDCADPADPEHRVYKSRQCFQMW